MSSWVGSAWGSSSWWGDGSDAGSSDAKWAADWKSQGVRWWENSTTKTENTSTKPSPGAGNATATSPAEDLAPWAARRSRDAKHDDASWSDARGRTASQQQQLQQQQQPQGARKRAQSSPPTSAVPARQDRWWLGVDSETRRKYTEEMRQWLQGIHSSLSKYFSIIEENYDTVDQICRLYGVDTRSPHAGRRGEYVDSLFFSDNQVHDLEHRRLFKQWFARRRGVEFVDDEAPEPAASTVSEQANQDHDAVTPSAPKDVAEDTAFATVHKAWQVGSGWGTWSAGSWNGGNSWWQQAADKGGDYASPVKDVARNYSNNQHPWTSSGWAEWRSNDRWN